MLGFVENIGHKYNFQGGGVVSGRGVGVGGGPDPKKKKFEQTINTYFQYR